MRYKRFMIILVLAVFALSVAGVCASDADTALESSADDSIIEVDDSQAIGQDENEEIVSEGNAGTFSDLRQMIQDAGDDATIILDSDYEADESGHVAFSNSKLVIDGKGHKIDAKNKTGIFNVQGSNVTIKNMTFANANGWAIYWADACVNGCVSDCLFINNTGPNRSGGAIDWMGVNGCVSNCSFIGNTAGAGGAIFWGGVNGCVSDCSFINNSAGGQGGAIDWKGVNGCVSDCLFINNTATVFGGAIIWEKDGGSVSGCSFIGNAAQGSFSSSTWGPAIYSWGFLSVEYCWFGFDANNYRSLPPIYGSVNYNCWLFLNAAVNPNTLPDVSTSEALFKLYLYNSSSGDVFEYDNAPLDYLNLTITATNGFTDKNSIKPGDELIYTATNKGTGTVTASIGDFRYTIKLDNYILSPMLSVQSQEIYFTPNTAIALNYNSSATGKVNITLKGRNGNNYTFTGLDLNATLSLGLINADEYDVTVTYSGDDNFTNANAEGTLKVFKANSTLTVNNITFDYNGTGVSEISSTGANTVVANVVDHPEAIVKVEGNTITVSNLAAGNYTLNVTTIAAENYNPVTKTAKITVNKLSTAINLFNETLDLKVKDMGYSLATLTPAGVGNLTYVSSNESVVVVVDGAYLACGKGTAIITVSFAGNENYTSAENRTITVTVTLNDASVSVENATLDLKVGERFDLNATSVPDYLTIEYVSSNSSVVSVTDYGIVTAVGEGTAVITLTVGDNETYAFNSTNVTVTVSRIASEIASSAITTVYNVNKDLTVTLKDEKGNPISDASITVDLNGAKTYVTDESGQVKVSTKGLAPKVYTVKISFDGDNKYIDSSADVKVTVNKATPKLTAKAKTFKTSVKTKKYTITLKDNTGKAIKKAKVTLKVKGKTYKATTNSKGKATFKIKNLKKKGKFKAVIKFKGDKYYKKATKKAKIKVIITFKTVSKGSKDKATVKQIQQALKDNGYYLSYKGHYLKVDGKFQSCTERSVKEFQKDKGLKVTGKVDEKTAKKLGLI